MRVADRIATLEAALRAAQKTVDALVRRQLQDSSADLSSDRFAVAKALSTLEGIVVKRTAALRTSEQRYRALYDCAPDLYATVDADGRLLQWNETFTRTLQIPAGRPRGGPIADLMTQDSADRLAVMLAGESVDHREDVSIDLQRSDGVTVCTTMRAVRLPAEDEREPVQVHLTFRDVTEKLRMERELAQAQRLAAVGALAAGVAHEINNPLTVVRGQADLLALSPTISEEQRARVVTIRDHSMRIAAIVTNLQTFAGTDGARRDRVRVDEAARQAVDVATTRRSTARVTVQTSGLPSDVAVFADRQRLTQALLNLVDNACDQARGEETVQVIVRADGEHVVVEVKDRGPGISAEHQERLFSPFFTTKDVGEGRGLGLAVSYGIVRELGGHIQAENRRGGGAVFRVTLPAIGAEAVQLPAPPPAPPSGGDGAGRLAVIVDDEPVIRDLVATILRDAGYRVLAFPTGMDALDGLGDEHADVVLTDVRMPGMDGLALREALISRYPHLQSRVILMTGVVEYTQRQDIACLPKPFSRDELLQAVGGTLEADVAAETP